MVEEFDQQSQPLVAGEFFVKITIGPVGLGKAAEFFNRLFHDQI
ncbi:MAG: hypothetical protein ABR514_04555 [Chthoniobacterales bacterium]